MNFIPSIVDGKAVRGKGQVNDPPVGLLGDRQRRGPHLPAELVGVVAEVLEEPAAVAEEAEQADGVVAFEVLRVW